MTCSGSCRTVVVADLPADKDALGPHDRLATALAELVRDEPGGKTIGLEGPWGRGKSTIVGLLKKRLASAPNSSVAVFDAWAHQGDPLRRSFLERIIKHLQGLGWIDKASWNNRLDEFAKRRKVTDTRTAPQLTFAGKMLVFTLLLVPVGLALFQAGLRANPPLKNGNTYMGLVATLAPILWLLLVVSLQWIRHRDSKGEPKSDDLSLWSLLISRAVSVTRTEAIETPEPTSVEFEQVFVELMDEALGSEERRLVLVLDNLDRVQATDALAIWATLQTFLQHSQSQKPPWHERLWVLLPYDRTAIERLWRDDPATEHNDGNNGSVERLATSFLDKSLQLRFEVPPPALSKWDAYFREDVLAEAFPDHDPNDFYDVCRVFAWLDEGRTDSPTPRELKLFANQIGALHRQWRGEMPLASLAYYALLRMRGVDVANGLLQGTLPNPDIAQIMGTAASVDLAALWFNANRTTAQELLLQGPISNALATGDPTALRGYLDTHGQVLWRLLESTIRANKDRLTTATYLTSAATALEDILSELTNEALTIREALRELAPALKQLSPFNGAMAKGTAAILRLLPQDEELWLAIKDGIASTSVRLDEEQDAAKVGPGEWIESFLLVAAALRGAGAPETPIVMPFEPGIWLSTASALNQRDPEGAYWRTLAPSAPPPQIESALTAEVAGGTFVAERVPAIRVSLICLPAYDWSLLGNAVLTRLHAGNTIPSVEIAALLQAIWLIREPSLNSSTAVSQLVTEGHLMHHFSQAFDDQHHDAMAWCVLLTLFARPVLAAPPSIGISDTGFNKLSNLATQPSSNPAFVSDLSDMLIREQQLGVLLPLLDSGTATPLVVEVLKSVFAAGYTNVLLDAGELVRRWTFLETQVFNKDRPAFEGAVRLFIRPPGLVEELIARTFDPAEAPMLELVLDEGAAESEDFVQWIRDGLGRVAAETWLSQLQTNGTLLGLIGSLARHGSGFRGEQPLRDGVFQFGEWLIAGNAFPPELLDSRQPVLASIDPGERELLRKDLLDSAGGRDKTVGASYFEFFDEELGDPDVLRRQPDVIRRLFIPLLAGRNSAGLSWLATVLARDASLVEGSNETAAAKDFKKRLGTAVGAELDEATKPITRIAELLSVVPLSETDSAPREVELDANDT